MKTTGLTDSLIKRLCRYHVENSLGKKLTGKVSVKFRIGDKFIDIDGAIVEWDDESTLIFDKVE
jgi:hypothetical protein